MQGGDSVLQARKYEKQQTIVKVFGTGENRKLKIITLNCLRVSGVEDRPEFETQEAAQAYADKLDEIHAQLNPDIDAIKELYRLALPAELTSSGDLAGDQSEGLVIEKMREAKSRARARIFELAFCNEWQWFFTGTLNSQKYDRTNLNKFHKDLTQWLRDYAKNRKIPKIDFLLIPELHKDGKSWHMHGLLRGLPVECLHQFRIGDIMGKGLADKVQAGDVVYNWEAYEKKFGFCDLEPVKDSEAVSKYCCKYITKSLQHSVKESGAHMYYHSRGLLRSEVVAIGTFTGSLPVPEYSNDYCSVSWLPYTEDNLQMIQNNMLRGVHYTSKGKGFAACIPGRDGAADRERNNRVSEPYSVSAY